MHKLKFLNDILLNTKYSCTTNLTMVEIIMSKALSRVQTRCNELSCLRQFQICDQTSHERQRFLATQLYAYLTNYRVNFVNHNRKCKIEERNLTNLAFYDWNRVIAQQIFYLLPFYCSCIKYRLCCHQHKFVYTRDGRIIEKKTRAVGEKQTVFF